MTLIVKSASPMIDVLKFLASGTTMISLLWTIGSSCELRLMISNGCGGSKTITADASVPTSNPLLSSRDHFGGFSEAKNPGEANVSQPLLIVNRMSQLLPVVQSSEIIVVPEAQNFSTSIIGDADFTIKVMMRLALDARQLITVANRQSYLPRPDVDRSMDYTPGTALRPVSASSCMFCLF
jgi:hypothetical protein